MGKELTGKRFGRLIALRVVGSKEHSGNLWECVCDCGKTHKAYATKLIHGRVKSCGCLQREVAAKRLIKHGLTHHNRKGKLFKVWCGMRERCFLEKE
nr:MAG TPA: hypothetical protein [Caudoviricetes sp.]